jgi:hypothetical protein
MFLAIINDTYAEVKSELSSDDDFDMMDYFKSSYNNLMVKLGKQTEQIEGIQQAIKEAGTAKKLSFEKVRDELKKRNLSDQEIEMLFAKYDLDQNRELDEDELKSMLSDLEGKKKELEREVEDNNKKPRPESARSVHRGHGGYNADTSKLQRRVDRMEYTLTSISSKIDSVLAGKILTRPDEVRPTLDEEDMEDEQAMKKWAK